MNKIYIYPNTYIANSGDQATILRLQILKQVDKIWNVVSFVEDLGVSTYVLAMCRNKEQYDFSIKTLVLNYCQANNIEIDIDNIIII